MPSAVAMELKRHVEAYSTGEVELPWGKPTWKPASAGAGVIPPCAEGAKPCQWAAAPKDGFHVLRHTCASILLEAGEPVVTVARWLGRSMPVITPGYYAHFMPEAGTKGRATMVCKRNGVGGLRKC